jgi:hypothetical protein
VEFFCLLFGQTRQGLLGHRVNSQWDD